MNQQIEVGARVRVRTVNGGEMVGTVSSRYVPGYALELLEAFASILAHRIVDVVRVPALETDLDPTITRHAENLAGVHGREAQDWARSEKGQAWARSQEPEDAAQAVRISDDGIVAQGFEKLFAFENLGEAELTLREAGYSKLADGRWVAS